MKVKTSYEHGEAITAGKEYEVIEWYPDEYVNSADIYDDEGNSIFIIVSDKFPCAFLNGKGNWEIVEEDD